ncbi:MAG: MaoC family dehydratase [bacterium]|nr:MaoC family dehydratase [bacterium]
MSSGKLAADGTCTVTTAEAAKGLASLRVGDEVRFSKTVGETDIYLFAGITGDFYEMHVNEEVMKASRFGTRIAHGALIVGFMSTTAGMMIGRSGEPAVSLGYDRVRFTAPVKVGDTVTVTYRISSLHPSRSRALADVVATNQHGETVAVATHIIRYL